MQIEDGATAVAHPQLRCSTQEVKPSPANGELSRSTGCACSNSPASGVDVPVASWKQSSGSEVRGIKSGARVAAEACKPTKQGTYSTPFLPCGVCRSLISMSSTAIGSVPSLSGHAIAHRWRSLAQGQRSSRQFQLRVLPFQVSPWTIIAGGLDGVYYVVQGHHTRVHLRFSILYKQTIACI